MLRLKERLRKRLRRAGFMRPGKLQGRPNLDRPVGSQGWYDYEVPVAMDFDDNLENTLSFFQGLRDLIGCFKKRVRITFEATNSISSEAMIYLLGQIYTLQEKYGRAMLTGCYPKSRRIEHLLNESGFFALLRVKRRPVAGRKTGATRFLTFKTGNRLMSEAIPKIRDELFGDDFQMSSQIKREVFRALSEAMNNVGEHAYLNKFVGSRVMRGRWWMGASMSVTRNVFNLTFYDAGVGIPKTLTRKYDWALIRKVLSLLPGFSPDDGAMIKAAVELGRTRTNMQNRGKGLMDLHRLIDRSGVGRLGIYSRNGWYRYRPSNDRSGSSVGFVEGTLISWQLPLDVATTQVNAVSSDGVEYDDA
jgi:hypothetical protein